MNRFVIMTVGMTHSGKTTFATELEKVMQQDAVVIDQDNHAEFINKHYMKLRPSEGPNMLKFSITNTIVAYAVEHSHMHILLSNSNLHEPSRRKVLRYFQEKGFQRILVYFELPYKLLEERVEKTQRHHKVFRNASSFSEILQRQRGSQQDRPGPEEAEYLFVIKDPCDFPVIIGQIQDLCMDNEQGELR
ncbi:MAG: ATP-binding protein [Paenibacillaceae bacterium]|uniref:ATP-binding protein n=1 Tax=Paenibacillus mellifer TaxID=2937794 RepID=A0A9X1XYQ9_9BACL|nr:ATP-binding protein [Paenibacillus mellifer]MBW4840674.1 ATP-binding protein [Paenibacillaceae bacterium]MCK8487749.1 ATP-binding protein [Paenibacillus mellifer]